MPVKINQTVKIVAFGELLWDMLPTGKKLGGAPVNFLYHARTLGAEVRALTRIGNDALGREIAERLDVLDVSRALLQTSPTAPTGTVAVTLDAAGTPSYKIVENVAWDEIAVDDSVDAALADFWASAPDAPGAFYFGSLALRSETNRRSLARLLANLPTGVVRVCDLNLRPPFFDRPVVETALADADVFKLNDAEALELDALFGADAPASASSFVGPDGALRLDDFAATRDAATAWAARWRERFDLQTIVLTAGSRGAFLFDGAETAFAPSEKVAVKDSVGAGDAFAAVCVVGLSLGRPLPEIAAAASRRAGFVCSQEGGTPPVPPEIADPFQN